VEDSGRVRFEAKTSKTSEVGGLQSMVRGLKRSVKEVEGHVALRSVSMQDMQEERRKCEPPPLPVSRAVKSHAYDRLRCTDVC